MPIFEPTNTTEHLEYLLNKSLVTGQETHWFRISAADLKRGKIRRICDHIKTTINDGDYEDSVVVIQDRSRQLTKIASESLENTINLLDNKDHELHLLFTPPEMWDELMNTMPDDYWD